MKNNTLKNILWTGILISASLSTFAISGFAEDEGDYTRNIKSNGIIQFTPDTNPTDPVDPNDPDPANPIKPWDPFTPNHEAVPGTAGPLSLDFASSLNFGNNKITNKDTIYYAEPQFLWNDDKSDFNPSSARPNYVQVTDKRGTNSGWTLTLQQQGQFKNEQTLNKELTGAALSFVNGKATSIIKDVAKPKTFDIIDLIPGETVNVMAAEKDAGAGTWVNYFGEIETIEVEGEMVQKNKAISLFVPGTTAKDAVKYETELLWTLTDAPAK